MTARHRVTARPIVSPGEEYGSNIHGDGMINSHQFGSTMKRGEWSERGEDLQEGEVYMCIYIFFFSPIFKFNSTWI